MSAFCCWGLPIALLTLLCSPGEPVPGVPDLACASPEGGLSPAASGRAEGPGPQAAEALNTVAARHGHGMLCHLTGPPPWAAGWGWGSWPSRHLVEQAPQLQGVWIGRSRRLNGGLGRGFRRQPGVKVQGR